MSRVAGTILNDQAYTKGAKAPMLDLALGGQMGYQAQFNQYINSAGHVPSPVQAFLLDIPTGFNYIPNKPKAIEALKNLIEIHSKQITGLRDGLNVETSERSIGRAGHKQSEFLKVTEEISTVSHIWDERHGRTISNFWKWYVRMFMGQPGIEQPQVMTLEMNQENLPTDILPDFYSFATLYVEPDRTRRNAVAAWLYLNQLPTGQVGLLESEFNAEQSFDVPEIPIEFRGIPIIGQGVLDYADLKLKEKSYANASPMARPAWLNKIKAEINAAAGGSVKQLEELAKTGIKID